MNAIQVRIPLTNAILTRNAYLIYHLNSDTAGRCIVMNSSPL